MPEGRWFFLLFLIGILGVTFAKIFPGIALLLDVYLSYILPPALIVFLVLVLWDIIRFRFPVVEEPYKRYKKLDLLLKIVFWVCMYFFVSVITVIGVEIKNNIDDRTTEYNKNRIPNSSTGFK